MEFVKYLKGCVWDLILCAVMAVSLCYAEGSGFYVTESLHKNYVLLLGVVVLTTAVLAAISYNKKTLIFGISGIAAALVLLFLVLGLNSRIGNVFADKPGNPWLYVTDVYKRQNEVWKRTGTKGETIPCGKTTGKSVLPAGM